MDGVNECVIEWFRGDVMASVTMPGHTRLNSRLKKLAADGLIDILLNKDGSIFCQVPATWVKISPPKRTNLTEEQKKDIAKRLKAARERREKDV